MVARNSPWCSPACRRTRRAPTSRPCGRRSRPCHSPCAGAAAAGGGAGDPSRRPGAARRSASPSVSVSPTRTGPARRPSTSSRRPTRRSIAPNTRDATGWRPDAPTWITRGRRDGNSDSGCSPRERDERGLVAPAGDPLAAAAGRYGLTTNFARRLLGCVIRAHAWRPLGGYARRSPPVTALAHASERAGSFADDLPGIERRELAAALEDAAVHDDGVDV